MSPIPSPNGALELCVWLKMEFKVGGGGNGGSENRDGGLRMKLKAPLKFKGFPSSGKSETSFCDQQFSGRN